MPLGPFCVPFVCPPLVLDYSTKTYKWKGLYIPNCSCPSVHPLLLAWGFGSQRQQSYQRDPDLPRPNILHQLYQGNFSAFPGQLGDIIMPAVLGLPQGLLLVKHVYSTPTGRRSGSNLARCLHHLNWLLFMLSIGTFWLLEFLLNDLGGISHHISKGEHRCPSEETHLCCLYSWSWLPTAHDHRWGWEHRSSDKSWALPCGSARSLPQQTGTESTSLLTQNQAACQSLTITEPSHKIPRYLNSPTRDELKADRLIRLQLESFLLRLINNLIIQQIYWMYLLLDNLLTIRFIFLNI